MNPEPPTPQEKRADELIDKHIPKDKLLYSKKTGTMYLVKKGTNSYRRAFVDPQTQAIHIIPRVRMSKKQRIKLRNEEKALLAAQKAND